MTYRDQLTGRQLSVPNVSRERTAWLHSNTGRFAASIYTIGDMAGTLQAQLATEPRFGECVALRGLANGRTEVDNLYASSLPPEVTGFDARKQIACSAWLARSTTTTKSLFYNLHKSLETWEKLPDLSGNERALLVRARSSLTAMRAELERALTPFPGLQPQQRER